MDEDQIFELVKGCKHLKFMFRGVFSADNFPLDFQANKFIIVNTAKSDSPGIHWVFIAKKDRNNVLFFADPLGFPAETYFNIIKELSAHNDYQLFDLMKNKQPLQNLNSQLCGLFCIYIAHFFVKLNSNVFPQIDELSLINFVKHMS